MKLWGIRNTNMERDKITWHMEYQENTKRNKINWRMEFEREEDKIAHGHGISMEFKREQDTIAYGFPIDSEENKITWRMKLPWDSKENISPGTWNSNGIRNRTRSLEIWNSIGIRKRASSPGTLNTNGIRKTRSPDKLNSNEI